MPVVIGQICLLLVTVLVCLPAWGQTSGPVPGESVVREPQMVPVPGGCFSMGSAEGNSDELPRHEVCLSPFSIGRFEVTQGEWRALMGNNPSRFNSCGADCPVDQVSWSDIQEYLTRLNRRTGKQYRLPTEAEWEYACREGGDVSYCGGGSIGVLGWFRDNSDGRPHPVGQKQPNRLGIYDMSGNVWEWVQDWKDEYPATPQKDPLGPRLGSTRARRGGSWHYPANQQRASWRSSGYPDDRALDLGFRLALTAPAPAPSLQGSK